MTNQAAAEEFRKELLSKQDYRGFLQILLKRRGAQAQLARRAGFGSRSYMSELLAGKKGLSQDMLSRLKSAIGLQKPWPQYFEYLVWLEESGLRPSKLAVEQLKEKLKTLRAELSTVKTSSVSKAALVATPCAPSPQLFQIYAALGTVDHGATKNEIVRRTGLNPTYATKYLKQLLEIGVIIQKEDRFYAPVSEADALSLENIDSVSEMVRMVCGHVQKNRVRIVSEPNNLTVYSAFSVQTEQLPLLKEQLRTAIFGVLDNFQNDSGDRVQQIFVSLHGNPIETEL